jgi:uncharacterized membrane protein (DUF106 family)
MKLEATEKSAALAGVWTGSGIVLVAPWLDHQHTLSTQGPDLFVLLAAIAFIFVPCFAFVFGSQPGVYSRFWFLDREKRAYHSALAKRIFVYFVSSLAVSCIWAMALSLITSKSI